MNEFQDLQATAAELYNSVENKNWIFTHTKDESEYWQVRHVLKILADWKPVEWQGETGHREPVQMGARA
ncbi:hypothetical protein [Methanomethylovorans sp.]|mgnify:CR=1 FL=1|uniref:hypothetical protein n=1 Tax=Methanomethylovorans sp. TaxID=2758717 RepID=UPI002FDD5F93